MFENCKGCKGICYISPNACQWNGRLCHVDLDTPLLLDASWSMYLSIYWVSCIVECIGFLHVTKCYQIYSKICVCDETLVEEALYLGFIVTPIWSNIEVLCISRVGFFTRKVFPHVYLVYVTLWVLSILFYNSLYVSLVVIG